MTGSLALFLSCLSPIQNPASSPLLFLPNTDSTCFQGLPSVPSSSNKPTSLHVLSASPLLTCADLRSLFTKSAVTSLTLPLLRLSVLPEWLSLTLLGLHHLLQDPTLASFLNDYSLHGCCLKGTCFRMGVGECRESSMSNGGGWWYLVLPALAATQATPGLPSNRSYKTVNTQPPPQCLLGFDKLLNKRFIITQQARNKGNTKACKAEFWPCVRKFVYVATQEETGSALEYCKSC